MTICFDGIRLFFLHGHTRSVKNGMTRAVLAARSKDADVLLFGHTHVPTDTYIPEETGDDGNVIYKPLRIFNPGSLGASGDGAAHFGLIEIRNGSVLTSHGILKQ
jgi:predicted phosphodiesterase